MKKLVFNTTIIILSVLALPAFSQIRFGVRGDIGLNNPTYKSDVLKVENTTNYSIGPSMETMLPLFVADAVSYTHLDVYKRQVYPSRNDRFNRD